MKGFKDSTKMCSGFKFPESAGFTSSSGKVQQVRGYTRQVVKKAAGGQVPMKQEPGGVNSYNTSKAVTIGDQGNSAELRTKPLTEFDKAHGGRGPLRPGFAMGGRVGNLMQRAMQNAQAKRPAATPQTGMSGPLRMGVGALQKAATGPQMRTAIPRGGMARRPLMRAGGGKVPSRGGGGQPHKQNKDVRASFATSAIASSSPSSESKEAMKARMMRAQDRITKSAFADGGKVPPKKPTAPPPAPPKKDTIIDIMKGKTRKQQEAELGLKKGGPVVGKIKRGALHSALGIPQGKKIPSSSLAKAAKSSSPLMRKRANFAINAKKWNHG